MAVGLLAFGARGARSRSAAGCGVTVVETAPGRSQASNGRCRRSRCWPGPSSRPGGRVAMLALEGYLLLAIALLIVKAIQLGGG